MVMETPQNSEGTASPTPLQTIGTAHPATGQGWAKGCPLLWGGGEQRDPITPLTAPLPRRMSMRSPVSPHLELDGAGSMVNCTIKTEEKKEGGYESPPGAAPSAEPRPSDPPGPPPREGTDPQALPQVGPTAVTPPSSPLVLALTEPGSHRAGSALHPAPGRRGLLFPRAFISHPEEMRLQPEAPPGFLAAADALGSALGFAFGLQPSLAACTPPPHGHPLIFPFQLLSAILSPCLIASRAQRSRAT